MRSPRKRFLYLGLIVIVASVVFGLVTYYFPGYPIVGDFYTVTNLGEGKQEVVIVVSPRGNETRGEFYGYLRAPYPDYPLRQYHALTYVFLAIGLVMTFCSLRIGRNIGTRLEKAKHMIMGKKLWIVLLIGLAIGFGLGYAVIPKGGGPAVFWQEIRSHGEFGGVGVVAVDPLPLPQSFKLSTITLCGSLEVITLHTYYFGANLEPGSRIPISINATAPIDFRLIFVNRWDANVHALSNEVRYYGRAIINASQITSVRFILHVQERGLYIFTFSPIQPKPVATVTFTGYLTRIGS